MANAKPYHLPTELALLCLLALLWGGSFPLSKIAVQSVPPMTVTLMRLFFALPAIFLIMRLFKTHLPTGWGNWGLLTLIGLTQNALPFSLIAYSQYFIASSEAGLLNATTPLFAFLIAFAALGRRQDALRKFIGVMIGFLGVGVLLSPNLSFTGINGYQGYVAMIIASISYALTAFLSEYAKSIDPVAKAGGSLIMSAVWLIPPVLYFDDPFSVQPTQAAILSIIAMGVLASGLGLAIWNRLIGTLGPIAVTSGSYLRSIVTIVLGVSFMGEPFTWSLIGGFVLIVFGVAMVLGQIRLPFAR